MLARIEVPNERRVYIPKGYAALKRQLATPIGRLRTMVNGRSVDPWPGALQITQLLDSLP